MAPTEYKPTFAVSIRVVRGSYRRIWSATANQSVSSGVIVTAALDLTNGNLTSATFSEGSETTYTRLAATSIAYTYAEPTSTERILASCGSCAIVKVSPV